MGSVDKLDGSAECTAASAELDEDGRASGWFGDAAVDDDGGGGAAGAVASDAGAVASAAGASQSKKCTIGWGGASGRY